MRFADDDMLTPREFCRAARVSYRTFLRLVHAGLLFGVTRTAMGRYRVPGVAVGMYLRGERPRDAISEPDGAKRLNLLWLKTMGRPCPNKPLTRKAR